MQDNVLSDTLLWNVAKTYGHDFAKLHKIDRNGLSVFHLLMHMFLLFGSAMLGYLLLGLPLSVFFKVPCVLVLVAIIASRMRALGNIIHECSHSTFFAKRKANLLVGEFLCIVDFQSFKKYKVDHYSHHRYVGDCIKDADFAKRRALFNAILFSGDKIILPRFFKVIFSAGFYAVYWNFIFFSPSEPVFLKILRIFNMLFHVILVYYFGWIFWLLFFALPYFFIFQWLKFFSDAVDHAGLMDNPSPKMRARNHLSAFWMINQLFFPRNDGYHLLHHLCPKVPTWNLPRLHKGLLSCPLYGRQTHGILNVFKLSAPKAVNSQKNEKLRRL